MIFGIFGTMFAVCMMIFLAFCFSKVLFGILIWCLIKLPLTIVLFAVGTVLCCTIILIPLGLMCFRIGGGLLMPCAC